MLEATNLNSYGNGNYSAITRAFDNTGITLETVEAISPTQLVLTFSEDIKLVCNEEKNQPFMAFRFVDPATGIVVFDDAGTPLQWVAIMNSIMDSRTDFCGPSIAATPTA